MAEKDLRIDLGDDGTLVVLAEQIGPQMVSDDKLEARLGSVTGPIERVGRELLEAVKGAKPSKATVEVGFGLAIEQGQLVALLGKGKAEANIKVVFEWAPTPGKPPE
jgi:hypothetical protein